MRNRHPARVLVASSSAPDLEAGARTETVFIVGLKCVFVISLHYYVVVIVDALLFLQIELGLGHALVRAALASRGDEPLCGDDAED